MSSFSTPWKHQKTVGFMAFSWGLKREQKWVKILFMLHYIFWGIVQCSQKNFDPVFFALLIDGAGVYVRRELSFIKKGQDHNIESN